MQTGDLEQQVNEESAAFSQTAEVSAAEPARPKEGEAPTSEPRRSLWRRLREKRREVAAVIALIVMAIIWFDTGGPEDGTVSMDPLAGYDAILSDFDPVGNEQALRESADPFETSSGDSAKRGLMIPQSSDLNVSQSVTARDSQTGFHSSASAANADYPENPSALNSPPTGTQSNNGTGQPNRRVRFAGRIQPAN